jgi:uncharacterized membrane protein (UPF0127 family)
MTKANLYNNPSQSETHPSSIQVTICESFKSRFLGLMFQKNIQSNNGLLFINKSENRFDAAIHMLFMNFDISVIWIDQNNVIIDKVIAKKWHPFYIPRYNAKMILETHVDNINLFSVGDTVIIEKI